MLQSTNTSQEQTALGRSSSEQRNIIWSSVIGATVEYYDFLIYGIASALLFNKIFFPSFDPVVGTIAAFGAHAVGFLARPIGGIIFGHFGDKVGRKAMLSLTLIIMGLGTFLIGCLPTYAQIGVWAPILLVTLRFIQGVGIGADCQIKTYALSDEQLRSLAKDAALITYKATVDGTCGGQQFPANSRAAAIYVRDHGTWKLAFHAQAAMVDPQAAPAKPVDRQQVPNGDNAQPANRNAGTAAMLAAETNVWEAWRVHDAKRIADLTADDISFINIFGVYLPTKRNALQGLVRNVLRCQKHQPHRRRWHDALAHRGGPDIQGQCGRHVLRSESWTYLGLVRLREARRCVEMDLWH